MAMAVVAGRPAHPFVKDPREIALFAKAALEGDLGQQGVGADEQLAGAIPRSRVSSSVNDQTVFARIRWEKWLGERPVMRVVCSHGRSSVRRLS